MLFRATLFRAAPFFRAVLFRPIFFRTALFRAALFRTALLRTARFRAALLLFRAAPAARDRARLAPARVPALLLPLAARGESPSAFDERCILAACVAPPSNTGGILGRRALTARRFTRLGATPDFHHGLLGLVRQLLTFVFSEQRDGSCSSSRRESDAARGVPSPAAHR